MTAEAIIIAVPILAACAFILVVLYVTVEEAFQNRRNEEL